MNDKTKKLMQIAAVLRLAENLIREFNAMDGETDIVSAEILDDIAPVKIHLYGDARHNIGLDFIDYPEKDCGTFYMTEHGYCEDGVYIYHAEYRDKEAADNAKLAV